MFLNFNIEKRLGDFHLKVKGTFEHGIIGITGESGSGKTSLLNCIAGIIKPDNAEIVSGNKVFFSSNNKINIPPEKRGIGMVFQEPLLFPHMSVKDNIYYGLRNRKDKKYPLSIIDLLNLYKLLGRNPESLSGGEKQRVSLARTLVHKPNILLMDEPLSSLDLKSRYQIAGYLKKIYGILKIPLVYVSHSFSELLYLVSNVLILKNGRNISYGPPEETLLEGELFLNNINENIENIYELSVQKIDRDTGMMTLDFGGFPLVLPYSSKQIRPSLKLGIKAREIMVATSKINGISARNIIPAVISKSFKYHDKVILHTIVRNRSCLVEITPAAYEGLGLIDNKEIYLIIKARSIIVFN